MKNICDIGEDRLIKRFRRIYKQHRHTLVGIGDDAAVVEVSRDRFLVFTSDMLVEGIHFQKREATPYRIGWKAMGSALSDIAAMAAVPVSAVISLGLPPGISVSFVDGLTRGIRAVADIFNVDVVGGDTVGSRKGIVVSVSVIGEVKKEEVTLRKGARVGDKIMVTGTLGGSRKRKQYRFIPRIKEARWLVRNANIHSMMDITDGLSIDLYRLVAESKVGARLYKEDIPLSEGARGIDSALADGEDFELLFTVSNIIAGKLMNKWKDKDVSITVIGEIISGRGRLELVDRFGKIKRIIPKGYEHFSSYKKP